MTTILQRSTEGPIADTCSIVTGSRISFSPSEPSEEKAGMSGSQRDATLRY